MYDEENELERLLPPISHLHLYEYTHHTVTSISTEK